MNENLKQIKLEVKKYKNTLVIDFNKIVLLLGYKKDPDDYYWHFETFGPNTKTYLSSCVGKFIPLINTLNRKDYDRLYIWFNLNRTK